jgi:signal transduction histidine kinase
VVVGLTAIVAQLALIVNLIMEMHRRKKSDLTIKNLSGRLINAGEEERKRIARELHDDIGQRLSLLSIELDGMERELPANQVAEREALSHSLQQINELVTDVHNLSHQLHSSKQ